jgi:hypothetical protein
LDLGKSCFEISDLLFVFGRLQFSDGGSLLTIRGSLLFGFDGGFEFTDLMLRPGRTSESANREDSCDRESDVNLGLWFHMYSIEPWLCPLFLLPPQIDLQQHVDRLPDRKKDHGKHDRRDDGYPRTCLDRRENGRKRAEPRK